MPIAQAVKKDTKTAIMDAAEITMAEHGVEGASIRAIVAKADANTAAIHYHFNSREGLVEAMIRRHGKFISPRRLEMIEEFDRAGDVPTPMDIVRFLIDPHIELLERKGEAGRRFLRFLARLQFDRKSRSHGTALQVQKEREYYPEIRVRLSQMLRQACPGVSETELDERLTMTIDTMSQSLANAQFMAVEWEADEQHKELRSYAANLKTFLVGGLAAPATKQQDQTEMVYE
jgi:AcrR family transcriptional regulator